MLWPSLGSTRMGIKADSSLELVLSNQLRILRNCEKPKAARQAPAGWSEDDGLREFVNWCTRELRAIGQEEEVQRSLTDELPGAAAGSQQSVVPLMDQADIATVHYTDGSQLPELDRKEVPPAAASPADEGIAEEGAASGETRVLHPAAPPAEKVDGDDPASGVAAGASETAAATLLESAS